MKSIQVLPDTVKIPYPYHLESPPSVNESFLSATSLIYDESTELTYDNSAILFYELCEATSAGKMDRVRYLVEVERVPLNVRDVWDSSPLYYACLCGHFTLVQYFLENGAMCEPNTFEAERCLYGALTDEIRTYLKSYNFTKSIDSLQPYAAFLYKLYNSRNSADGLVVFRVFEHGNFEEIYVHRWLLSARSSVFRQFFLRRWRNVNVVEVKNRRFKIACFKVVLMWMYTGRVDLGIIGIHSSTNLCLNGSTTKLLDCLLLMCRIWKLETLESSVKSSVGIANDLSSSLLDRMGGHVGIEKVQQDFSKLIKIIDGSRTILTVMSLSNSVMADVVLKVDGHYFPAHKDILEGQSEYFSAMFRGNFSDPGDIPVSSDNSTLKILKIINLEDIEWLSADSFQLMMEYMYTDHVSIPSDKVSTAYRLLHLSDMFLLEKLKSLTVVVLCGLLASLSRGITKSSVFGRKQNSQSIVMDISIFELLTVAIDFELDRLEKQCIQYIAFHFDDFYKKDEFKEIILFSARTIHERQEKDTIPFVDDLKWYLLHLNDEELLDCKTGNKTGNLKRSKEHNRDGSLNVFVSELDSLRRINGLEDILNELNLKTISK